MYMYVCVVSLSNITRLMLSHNKITILPPEVVELRNLEYLNLFNNQLEVWFPCAIALPMHYALCMWLVGSAQHHQCTPTTEGAKYCVSGMVAICIGRRLCV